MFKRISVGLLAIIVCAIGLELGERFEIPGCTASFPPQRLSLAAP